MNVLIIDDHEIVAESLIRLLDKDPDIDVIGAALTAQGGLHWARERHPDIVVLDYYLPDMAGAQMVDLLRAEVPDSKVVILTGSETAAGYQQAMTAGCSAWLNKSMAVTDIIDTIHKVHGGTLIAHDSFSLPTIEELVVHYQPIVDLRTEDVVGFEALVRWDDPAKGLVGPDAFLPLAEETGFIVEIGAEVARQATAQLAVWHERYPRSPRLFMSINLSARGLTRPGLIDTMRAHLAGIEPADLTVEITETVLLDDANLAQLHALKAMGIHVALDDFGTAFSSLSYLRRFPFDRLKIDTSFTAELPAGARARQLVEAIEHLSRTLNIESIAEGIERPEQAACLRDSGWRLGQGYLYSRPVPAEEAEALLAVS